MNAAVANLKIVSNRVKQQADALSARCLHFQDLLMTLPGKQHEMTLSLGDVSILLLRQKDKWVIAAKGTNHPDFKPLIDCSVTLKMAVLSKAEDFVVAIAQWNNGYLERLQSACDGYDKIIESLGLPPVGWASPPVAETSNR